MQWPELSPETKLRPDSFPSSFHYKMKNSIRLILAIVAVLAANAPASAAAQGSGDLSGQTLSPGDQIRIVVYKDPDLSCDCFVGANGTMIHPLYREVPVTGVPLTVVEERIRVFLSKYKQTPQFVIQPLVKIVVRGEVRQPNIYSVPPETTIAQAVQLAGGVSDNGRLDRVAVIRDRQTINIDLSKPDAEANMLQIRSNDQVVIGRKRQPVMQYISPVMSSLGFVLTLVNILTR